MSGFRQEDILIIMCVLIIIFHLDDPAVIVREEFVRTDPLRKLRPLILAPPVNG